MSAAAQLDRATLMALPKVQLHSHLDGALRPATLIELFSQAPTGDLVLPSTDPKQLQEITRHRANSGSLPQYLQAFDYTTAAMQTPEALHRVALEYTLDRASEGVLYGETRFAPEQHMRQGLTLPQVVEAVLAGLREGEKTAEAAGQSIHIGLILDAMRQNPDPNIAEQVAKVAVDKRSEGVVGFDIAGPELGFPPDRLETAFAIARVAGLPITIHAGEGDGLSSIVAALRQGAARIGHGVRIAEDITIDHDGEIVLGSVARGVRDAGIVLEVCPTSNVQTGAVASWETHPLRVLYDAGFSLTISSDNEFVSVTNIVDEYHHAHTRFGFGVNEFRQININAAQGAFLSEGQRAQLIHEITTSHAIPPHQ